MKTFNTYFSSQQDLKDFIELNNIRDSKSLLIQVFTAKTDKEFISSLTKSIDELLPQSILIGTTTDGEICDGVVSTMKTIISFTLFSTTTLKIYKADNIDDYFKSGVDLASSIIQENTQVIISFIDGLSGNGEEFLNGIDSVNKKIKVAGGLSGDNGVFENTYVFSKDEILCNGAVGVALNSDSLHVHTQYSFDWLPIGKELKVTKAIKNRVYTIEDKTAHETYAHYLGPNIADKLPSIGIEFPLIIKKDGVAVARACLGIEDDGSLIFAGNINEGDLVRFGYGNSESILKYKNDNVDKLLDVPVESIFIYSCMARRRFMPDDIEMETKAFSKIASTSGFFTYGEFYTASSKELLNQSMTILALSESDNIDKTILHEESEKEMNNDTLKALSHLINTTSTELNSINIKQTEIYNTLHNIGKKLNENLSIDEVYEIAVSFITKELNFEKCLIFQHDDKNGWFKIVKAAGYENPMEHKILKIINLLLSGEIIEYLRVSGDPIVYTQELKNEIVEKLVKSLFLSECHFELFGGTVEIPFGLMVVGNGFKSLKEHSRIHRDKIEMLALGNFAVQFSYTINNIIFYKAWTDEKVDLEKNILKRTAELNEQKNTFEAIYKTSKDGIAILDIQTTAFLDVNEAFEDMTGYSKKELLQISCLKLSLDNDIKRSKIALQRVMKDGSITNFIKACKTKSGDVITINISVALMSDITKVLVSAKDITQQKILEEKLIEQKQKAEESTKSKSEFLANMSHEIRTPMNGILGMSHLVLQTPLSSKQKDYVHKIDNSAKSLLGIINDILDFSKIEAGKLSIEKEEFDIFKTIDNVINIIEYKAHEKNLEVIVGYDRDIGKKFYGDALRIGQILTNLLSNAVKFTHSGEIGVYVKKVSNKIFRFEVVDTGIGLTQIQVSKLFQSFSQADGSTTRKYGGTGLGLTISKQLVELMGGEIWCESEYGKGSKFIFEIELEEREDSKIFNIFKDKKILVVDDHKAWHEILSNMLSMFHVSVDSAYSGLEALERLQDNSYDLILMDWSMPGLDGIETTKMIQEKCVREIPPAVIMVSSFRHEAIVKQAQDIGIDLFLQKPINPSLLNNILSGMFLDGVTLQDTNENKKVSLKSSIGSLKGSNILLTEDNITNQEIIIGLLENSGINIDIANNGQEALSMFKQNADKYELIFMDLQMPIMDGYRATELIREIDKDIPIVALTANAMKEDVQRTSVAGMNEHLNKPIDVEKLYATLLKYISKKVVQTDSVETKEEIEIPKFKNIDIEVGLKHLVGNKKLYLKILKNFYLDYCDLNLESLDDTELKRVIHTIKGLSANIGATALNTLSIEIDRDLDRKLFPLFNAELNRVVDELQALEKESDIEDTISKKPISNQEKERLFSELKAVVKTKRIKNCKRVIEELNLYELSDDQKLFNEIKVMIEKYKFKDAIALVESI